MSDQLPYVFRSSYQGAGLFSHSDFDDVASASALLDNTYSAMVAAMRHALVHARVDAYRDLVAGVVGSEKATEADLASLSRPLSEERPSL